MTITKNTRDIAACNNCGATTYDQPWSPRTADAIFDIDIARMRISLCPSCLQDLVNAASNALEKRNVDLQFSLWYNAPKDTKETKDEANGFTESQGNCKGFLAH